TAVEHGRAATDAVAAMTALAARHLDLAAITALADTRATGPAWDPRAEVGAPVTGAPLVALAAGKAFSCGYPEHAELLRAAGAQTRRAATTASAARTALAERHLDPAATTALADTRATGPAWDPRAEVGAPVTGAPLVALAAGKAFSFGYPEHAELLRAAGAQF